MPGFIICHRCFLRRLSAFKTFKPRYLAISCFRKTIAVCIHAHISAMLAQHFPHLVIYVVCVLLMFLITGCHSKFCHFLSNLLHSTSYETYPKLYQNAILFLADINVLLQIFINILRNVGTLYGKWVHKYVI